jgi:hypothetical protein
VTEEPSPITRFDAHTFEGPADSPRDEICSFCEFPRSSIIHHPSRIKATMAIVRRPRSADAKAG